MQKTLLENARLLYQSRCLVLEEPYMPSIAFIRDLLIRFNQHFEKTIDGEAGGFKNFYICLMWFSRLLYTVLV